MFMFMHSANAFIQSDLQVGRWGKGVLPNEPLLEVVPFMQGIINTFKCIAK